MEQKNNFLHKKLPELQKSEEVQDAVDKHIRVTGEKVSNNPEARLEVYMDRLEKIFLNEDEETRKRNIEMLRDKIHDAFVIKREDVPESYFELQKRVARERGQPVEEIPQNIKEQMIDVIIEDQKHSLDSWVNYLSSNDAMYPTWFKYFAFRNIVKLSQFDKELGKFKERTKATTAPFPDIYREALAQVSDLYESASRDKALFNDKDFQTFLSKKFPTQYADKIQQTLEHSQESREQIEGQWVKYEQGNEGEAKKLFESLQSKGTGWCTAGHSTALQQIESGDFYVFYTNDKEGNPTTPRLAIRMDGMNTIGEVRGVLPHQEVEPLLQEVLDEKLSTFGKQADKYRKKASDMKHLTLIEKSLESKNKLTKEDLLFLFESSEKITGFGYEPDPRIEELRKKITKEIIQDSFNLKPEEIAVNFEEVTDVTVLYFPEMNHFLSSDNNLKEHYKGLIDNLKKISKIYSETKNNKPLSKNKLKTLYQIKEEGTESSHFNEEETSDFTDEEISYLNDVELKKNFTLINCLDIIKEERNLEEDLAIIFECSPEDIVKEKHKIKGSTRLFLKKVRRDSYSEKKDTLIFDLKSKRNSEAHLTLKKLELLEKKEESGETFTKEDVRFIWQGKLNKEELGYSNFSSGNVYGINITSILGYSREEIYPFRKIRSERNLKNDIAFVFEYNPEEIITDVKDVNENTKAYFNPSDGFVEHSLSKISKERALKLSQITKNIMENGSKASISFEINQGLANVEIKEDIIKDLSTALDYYNLERDQYEEPDDEGNYPSRDETFNRLSSLPFDMPEKLSFETVFIQYKKEIKIEEILKDIKKIGLRPATFTELLALGINKPNLSSENDYTITALGSSTEAYNASYPPYRGGKCFPFIGQYIEPDFEDYGRNDYLPLLGAHEEFNIIHRQSPESSVYLCVRE